MVLLFSRNSKNIIHRDLKHFATTYINIYYINNDILKILKLILSYLYHTNLITPFHDKLD